PFFADRYGAAKSSISEDLAILRQTLANDQNGILETVAGAAGGVRYIPFVGKKEAKFNEADFERLMQDKGIIRNRLKINAAINNAKVLVKLENNNQTFKQILTKFIPEPINHHPKKMEDVPTSNELSNQISKEMKNLGFKFVGPITIYSFLQAVGLI